MKLGIIAICLSIMALGFIVFATVDTLGGEDMEPAPIPEAGAAPAVAPWVDWPCENWAGIVAPLKGNCEAGGGCMMYLEGRRYFDENCPEAFRRFVPPTP